jgi:hypothetical protein
MANAASPYENLISARSRRLRTIGVILVVFVVGMAVYGATSLMPSLRRTSALYRQQTRAVEQARFADPQAGAQEESVRQQTKKVLRTQVIFAYGYWTVCGTLLVSLLFVAWLDFREVTRNYLLRRVALLNETASRPEPPAGTER